MIKKVAAVLLIIFISVTNVYAADEDTQYDKYTDEITDRLEEAVDPDIWSTIEDFGLNDFSGDSIYSGSFDKISEYFRICLSEKISSVKESFFIMLTVIVICSVIRMLILSESNSIITMIQTALIISVVTAQINSSVNGVLSSMKAASAFMLAFLPIFTVIIAISGKVTSAASYNTLTAAFAQGISLFTNYYAADIVGVYFALVVSMSFNKLFNLNRFTAAFNKAVNSAVVFVTGIFTALLSFRSILSVPVDSAASKSIRFLLSSFIPIIGPSISEAYSSVIGSIEVIKGSVAAVGIVAMLLISLPPIIEVGTYMISLSVLSYLSEMLGDTTGADILKMFNVGLRFIVALSSLQLFILIISTGIMLTVKGAL